jgi:hypothetical protein
MKAASILGVGKALFQLDLPKERSHALYRTFTVSVMADYVLWKWQEGR